jgi:two-component system response regulator PilR (NtrC family)
MTLRPAEPRVLIVDDEPALRQTLEILLKRAGYQVTLCAGQRDANDAITNAPQPFPLILTDLSMPDGSGLDVLSAAKSRSIATQVVLLTAHSTVENAVSAMGGGAYDFITKPFENAELLAVLGKALEKHALLEENEALRAQVKVERGGITGRSQAIKKTLDLVDRIATSRTSVLVTGESGTGKERVARRIHELSERAEKPFLVINCGALPENLMESELFGHEKGAFTGASERTLGVFREADGGTVMLDEVGELPGPLQVKLLRVLQERAVRPVGAAKEIPIDVRLLAATNRDIENDVKSGAFRQDLYYRINVIRVELPPLRERRDDIPLLAEEFIRRFSAEMGKQLRGFTADAMRALMRYEYPGNVRELENVLERAATLAGSAMIGLGDLPEELSGLAGGATPQLLTLPEDGCELDDVLREVERRLLLEALERTGGVRTQAAKLLGISFRSFRYRLEKQSLDAGDQDAEFNSDSDADSTPPGD